MCRLKTAYCQCVTVSYIVGFKGIINKVLSDEKPYFQSFNLSNTITGRLPTKPYYLILSRLEQINLILRFWKSFKILPRSIPRRGKP